MRKLILAAVAAWFGCAVSIFVPTAMAGSVDAPFVHVDWHRGWVHVCAPFVDLYTPAPCGCCDCQPACGDRVGRSYDQAWAPGHLSESAHWLYDSLGRFKTADLWRHYLAVSPGEPLADDPKRQFDAADTAELKTVLENFDSAAADEQYGMISSLPAFQRTRELLVQAVRQRENSPSAVSFHKSEAVGEAEVIARPRDTSPRWSPASKQPLVGLPRPGAARDIARPAVEELPGPQ